MLIRVSSTKLLMSFVSFGLPEAVDFFTSKTVLRFDNLEMIKRSFRHLVQQDPGFEPARVVTVNLDLPNRHKPLPAPHSPALATTSGS